MRAARKGPVIITDGGRPSHVLLTYEAYLQLSGESTDITALLAMPNAADIPFTAPRLGRITQAVDLD